MCRTVDRDAEVRGNVFAASDAGGDEPTAKVELSVAGETPAQQLDLLHPADLGLQAISVFVAQCAELYVDAENAVAFVPAELRLVARLATTQDEMRGDLDREATALARSGPSFAGFPTDTAVGRRLQSLSGSTNLVALRALAAVSETDRARVAELRSALAARETATARADAQAAEQDARQAEGLAAQLRQLDERIAPAAVEALRAVASESVAAETAVEPSAQEFAGLPVSGVGGAAWRQLWQAARAFAAGGGSAFPPSPGEACPFCLQEVTPDTASRLAHFEEHVRSSVQEEARQKRAALDAALAALDVRHLAASRTPFLVGLRDREPSLHAAVERRLDAVGSHMEAMRTDPTAAQALPVVDDSVDQLENWGRERMAHAQTLLAADDPERERALRVELAELDARASLAPRLDDIAQWVGTLRRVPALRRAHSALATNRITIKQRQLSEQAVTGTIDAKLKEELTNLDCSHIPVDLHPETRVGETQIALRLA